MAREINTIYNEIIEEKKTHVSLSELLPSDENADNLLNDLTSTSKVAIWRLWAFLMAVAIHTNEVLWDLFKVQLDEIAAAAPAGTPKWYKKMIEAFQYEDSLEYIDNTYQYAIIDEEKRIIKRCAIEERNDGVVVIKVAKLEGGSPAPLSIDEKAALTSYANKIKFAGTRLGVISIPADQLLLNFNIYYDPIIPLSTVQENVRLKIENHLANLDFNAALNITKLTDVIQQAEGVKDPVFMSASNKPEGGISNAFSVEVIPAAGWFTLAAPVDQMFNFLPKL